MEPMGKDPTGRRADPGKFLVNEIVRPHFLWLTSRQRGSFGLPLPLSEARLAV